MERIWVERNSITENIFRLQHYNKNTEHFSNNTADNRPLKSHSSSHLIHFADESEGEVRSPRHPSCQAGDIKARPHKATGITQPAAARFASDVSGLWGRLSQWFQRAAADGRVKAVM